METVLQKSLVVTLPFHVAVDLIRHKFTLLSTASALHTKKFKQQSLGVETVLQRSIAVTHFHLLCCGLFNDTMKEDFLPRLYWLQLCAVHTQ